MRPYIICASEFNRLVVERLVEGARRKWTELGVAAEAIEVHWVPGAVELPLAAQTLIQVRQPVAVCAVGAVIRGGTAHFEYVSQSAYSGLMQVMLHTETPIGLGVLTTDDTMQALERADGKMGNKGAEAAHAAFELAKMRRKVSAQGTKVARDRRGLAQKALKSVNLSGQEAAPENRPTP